MNLEDIKKSNRRVAISAIIFGGLMILILHAALITMVSRDYERLGGILVKQIGDNFYSTSPADESVYNLNQDSLSKFLKDYPAAYINIYAADSKKIFSLNDKVIAVVKDKCYLDYIAEYFMQRTSEGKQVDDSARFSQIIWSSDFGLEKDKSFIRVVEPLLINKERVGTVEVLYDFSYHLRMINNTRFFCFSLIVVMIFCYFVVIDRNFSYLEKIINNQSQ